MIQKAAIIRKFYIRILAVYEIIFDFGYWVLNERGVVQHDDDERCDMSL